MPLLALFGITNEGLNLFVNLLILFLVVVWIALIAWTYLDARRRIRDPVLIACATGASLFPYVGTVVYAILRPPEFVDEAHERELEIRAAELRLKHLEEQSCPSCGYPIERTYLRCPSCRTRVKDPCESCEKPIDPRWTICPYCEMPQRRAAPQGRRSPDEPRRAPDAERSPKRTARGKRSAPEAGRRQPAQSGRSDQTRVSATRQAPAGSRQSAKAKQPKPGSGRAAPGTAPPRETSGEDRPRPATAS